MIKNRIILFFAVLSMQLFFGQGVERQILKGKIITESDFLEDIHVINISNNDVVIAQRDGFFSINAGVNDTLMFSAINLKGYQRVVNAFDLSSKLIYVPMEVLVNQLAGVTVTEYKNINAVSLGIIPKGEKTYTPAERKLISAGGIGIVGLINLINGRREMLKKELIVEGKELLQEATIDYFTKDYITKTLKIPEEYVEGFLYYIVEDSRFANEMTNDNKAMAAFILSELATEYITLQKTIKDESNEKE